MQVLVNERLLRRRLWFSLASMVGSILLLLLGFVGSTIVRDPLLQYAVSLPPLIVGIVLWSRNQAYLQRWGPRMRPDGAITRALRGLDARYALLVAPGSRLPDYVLVGPMGVVVVVPRTVTGTVTCYHGRWRHDDGRPVMLRLLSWLSVRPTLGTPTAEVERGVERTRRALAQRMPADLADALPVEGVVLFTHPQVNLALQGCDVPSITLKALRAHVRRLPRSLDSHAVQQTVASFGVSPDSG